MSLAEDAVPLKQAIDHNDLDRIISLMTANPQLHGAPLGYGGDGPLTWVAECRVPWEPPSAKRLAIAKWMIDNGSDVHQGGDGPLMRASLNGDRIPMMELLVSCGANVNASWHGSFPIIFAPCETLDAQALRWLLEHGADHRCGALDYLIGTYLRDPENLQECIEVLLNAGATPKFDAPAVMAVLRGQTDTLSAQLDADPTLVSRRFDQLDFGTTGGRLLTLRGATLLHVAAEYQNADAAALLLRRGADVNAAATVLTTGIGGQTPIFHAATQGDDAGLPIVKLLLENGADLQVRAKLPGHYERPDELVECMPLEYALLFPGGENETTALLRAATT